MKPSFPLVGGQPPRIPSLVVASTEASKTDGAERLPDVLHSQQAGGVVPGKSCSWNRGWDPHASL